MAGRGAYDTTIMEEIRRRGSRFPSSRAEEAGITQRDEAVRRMNIRRGGQRANSTAYTVDRVSAPSASRGGGGHVNAPPPGDLPGKNVPIPTARPDDVPTPTPRPKDRTWPWGIPGYTPPGDTAPINPPPDPRLPGGGGGGPNQPGPQPPNLPPVQDTPINVPVTPGNIPPELLPLVVAAGVSSLAGRQKMYPSPGQVDTVIQQSLGGLPVPYNYPEAETSPIRDPLALPSPRQPALTVTTPKQERLPASPSVRMLPSPTDVPTRTLPGSPPILALPPPQQAPIDIPLGDKKARVKVRKPRGPRVKTKIRL